MTRLLIVDHFKTAWHSLKTTKTRTLLTTLGVAIGVASITTILALSGGVTQIVSRQVESLEGNIAVVRPGVPTEQTNDFIKPTTSHTYIASTLTEKDYDDTLQIKDVEAAAPLMVVPGSISNDSIKVKNGTILATTPSLATIAGLEIREGQFIDSVTNKDTAVIGSQLSVDLFGTEQSIGQTFKIRNQIFTIIGVLKTLDDPVNFNNVDFNRTAIISLESGKSFHQGIAQIHQIDIKAKDAAALSGVTTAVKDVLTNNHLGEEDFSIFSGDEITQPTSEFFTGLAGMMTAIAGISLLVGGVGIMNIMLVSVAERTREIGLRKSVGASNTHIIWQFLTEALIISVIGGIVGYVGGYIIALVVSSSLGFSPALTWQIAGASLGVALLVGIVFGIYPALRAARKDPIESLRHYH
jgi:ABC-type antimicrobial peptide transport system permease subunit